MSFNSTAWGKSLGVSLAAVLATTSLYAIPKGPCDPKGPEVCCEEPKPGPFGFAFPVDMGIACPRDFYVRGEALAFQAKSDGMDFAIIDNGGDGAPLTGGTVVGFSSNHSGWDYNPGARFGVGFFLDHDAWNLDFCWTWVNITNYKSTNAGPSGVAIPTTTLGDGLDATDLGSRASAVWKASYNTLDARLGKPFHVSRYVTFHPHFGIRAAWIDQHFSSHFAGSASANASFSHADNDFWGFGARAGVDTEWSLGKGWCLFGNIASSMLYGKFDVDQNIVTAGADDGAAVDKGSYQNVPNFEIALGLGWGMHFDKDRYHIGLKLGYEFLEWWDQLNTLRFFSGTPYYPNDTVSRGNLSLNGFSFKVQLDI